jgi:hypothetical protein
MKNKILILLTLLMTKNVFASDTMLKLNATIVAGCEIKMNDVELGDLTGVITVEGIDSTGGSKNTALKIKCTKGTPYKITIPVAQPLQNPIYDPSKSEDKYKENFRYVYPLRNSNDPNEYMGHRFVIINSSDRANGAEVLGDGTTNAIGVKSGYIEGVGSGSERIVDLKVAYWTYKLHSTGTYSATHVFTVTY